MRKKTKPKKVEKEITGQKPEKVSEQKTQIEDNAVWSVDQQKKSYYYDDAYGYEIYVPEKDDD